MGGPPKGLDWKQITVVEDPVEWFPSFNHVLYCSLDFDMFQIYVMYFMVFEAFLSDNSLLSLFFVYIIERILRKIRMEAGQSNMCKKTYIDSCFLS